MLHDLSRFFTIRTNHDINNHVVTETTIFLKISAFTAHNLIVKEPTAN